jgi:hypothetical protein
MTTFREWLVKYANKTGNHLRARDAGARSFDDRHPGVWDDPEHRNDIGYLIDKDIWRRKNDDASWRMFR